MSAKGKKRAPRALIIALAVVVAAAALALYAGDYSRADGAALEAMARADAASGEYTFGDESGGAGLILYPGGKVEYTAYAPLAESIAQSADILCVVPEMPLNLAVLDSGAAAEITARYPDIGRWYIGGHSLGGAMAASYAAGNPGDFNGVVLLAAYTTEPLEIPVLSVYGENDTVLNLEKYQEGRALARGGFTEEIIEGGNHAQFGDYGEQEGDAPAAISPYEQRALTADAIAAWLGALAA